MNETAKRLALVRAELAAAEREHAELRTAAVEAGATSASLQSLDELQHTRREWRGSLVREALHAFCGIAQATTTPLAPSVADPLLAALAALPCGQATDQTPPSLSSAQRSAKTEPTLRPAAEAPVPATTASARFRRHAPARISIPLASSTPVVASAPPACTLDEGVQLPADRSGTTTQLPLSARSAISSLSCESYSSC